MKKYIKNIVILMACFLVISSLFYVTNANEAGTATKISSTYSSEMQSLITSAESGDLSKDDTGTTTTVNKITGTVITVVRIVGVCIAVTMLLVVAMKYMTAAPGEKADIKKSAIVYVVGAIVLFAVTGLLGIISQFARVIE